MKKIKMLGLALVVALAFAGCKNNLENGESANSRLSSILPKEYSKIGENHNRILYDFYFNSSASRTALSSGNLNYKELPLEEYFGKFESRYYFEDFSSFASRSAASDETVTSSLVEEGLISESGSEYISEIEKILANPFNSIEEMQENISRIEIEALSNKSSEELCEFLSYAETAKASLEFWNDNIEVLENAEVNSARGLFSNLWNKYSHRLGMMAASDAAGAAAGAIAGAALGSAAAGVGAGPGAAIGAVVAGAASSAEGFRKDCVCVVIPVDKIKAKF